jgi:glyoxylase-like metal-dependent hydrolase (beta-lactamase superfamily II)
MPTELPIFTFLISHPEGNILFDTGMSPSCNDPGYFPFWAPGIKIMSQIHIQPNEGIGSQLRAKGVEPSSLKAVVVSHVHHDHSGGLSDLEGAPVFMNKEHWEAFKNPIKSTIQGAAPSHWPKDFKPELLEAKGGPIGPFERSYPITSDGNVVAVDTPGHMPGHVSLVVFGEDATYFLTGDATYNLELLDREEVDGVSDDMLKAAETLRKIKQLARERPLIVLPSHDTKSKERLEGKIVYKPSKL